MSEHIFFQGNPSGKADDAPSELSTLSVLCALFGKVNALERRIERIERLLSHKTGKLAGNDFGAVFLDELGQEEQGGADELADD